MGLCLRPADAGKEKPERDLQLATAESRTGGDDNSFLRMTLRNTSAKKIARSPKGAGASPAGTSSARILLRAARRCLRTAWDVVSGCPAHENCKNLERSGQAPVRWQILQRKRGRPESRMRSMSWHKAAAGGAAWSKTERMRIAAPRMKGRRFRFAGVFAVCEQLTLLSKAVSFQGDGQ